jgi:hypothetical protein
VERLSPTEPILRSRGKKPGKDALRGAGTGLDPRQAIQQWIKFAQAKSYTRVTGNRRFISDIKTTIFEKEEISRIEFCVCKYAKNYAKVLNVVALSSAPTGRDSQSPGQRPGKRLTEPRQP